MRTVTEFNAIEQLARLRAGWADLLRQTPGATWFQSLEWLETYWQFYGQNQQLRVLVIEENGVPKGVLPLVVSSEPRRIGPVRVLTYPLSGWGSFYGPIGPDPDGTLRSGFQHIARTPHDWDLIDLRWIDATGIDYGGTAQAMEAARFHCDAHLWHTAAHVELHDGWNAYWRSRKPHWRSNVRRSQRRLSKRGTIEHVRYRPKGTEQGEANPRWDLYEACVEIARRSWQGTSKTGTTLSHDSVRPFLRAAHAAAVRAGAVDLNLLLLDGKPVAFAYNYHFDGSLYGLRSGFDRTAVQEGAGTVLTARMIQDSCRRGDRLIDLGPDYLTCKRYWLTRLRPAYHYTHYRPTGFRAQALRLKHAVNRWLEQGMTASPNSTKTA